MSPSDGPEFSIIVPTLDEASVLADTLSRARAALGTRHEVIVVDGGSRDDTVEIARSHGRVLTAPRNRGAQLRAGAEAANGDVFVFLHADTWLSDGAGDAIRSAVRDGAGAGCFRFGIQPPRDLRYRLLERGVNWRTRRFRTATGDQAIFSTRTAYDAVGGIPADPLFEDVAFVRRLRALTPFATLDIAAHTSNRRWEDRGFYRTMTAHWLLRLAFALGVSAERLGRLYARGRRSGSGRAD